MSIGIYKITNVINNKFYIGSSIDLLHRKSVHLCNGKRNNPNSIMRNAVLKYGKENFVFEIIEELFFSKFAAVEYIDEILEGREQYYVDILKPKYNIRIKDITRNTGVKKSLETIYKVTGENSKMSILIDVYDIKTLNLLDTVKGVRECSKIYKIDSSSISKYCKGFYPKSTNRKYIFRYHGDSLDNIFYEQKYKKGFKRTEVPSILQVDKNGCVIKEWRTMMEAEESLELYQGAVSRVVSGKQKHAKNLFFKYK